MTEPPDVVIIGGGPAGAATGTLLAEAGHKVSLFEMSAFPRFHVGESLIPAANLTLERLGVLADLDARRFPRKHGVQFFTENGPSRPFYFSEASDPRLHVTWQVLRSDFDALLLERARAAGVAIHTETQVADVRTAEDGGDTVTGVVVEDANGIRTIPARAVVDASGQRGLLARRFGERSNVEELRNIAFFAHYEGVTRDSGIDAGSTLIFRIGDSAWLWFIPLPDAVSIGLVRPARNVAALKAPPYEILDQAIAAAPALAERLTRARRTTDVHVARDFSYRARRDGGKGWLLAGDALGFIDPIYSSGLFLTLSSAELAANAVDGGLTNGTGTEPLDFHGFSAAYQRAFDRFLSLVRAFYAPDFHFGELAKNPAHRQGLVDMLIGNVETSFAVAVAKEIDEVCQGGARRT